MKRIAYALLWVYIRLIRVWWSPLWALAFTHRVKPRTGLWEEYKYLPPHEFAKKLKQVKYSGDPLGGFLDYTITDPEKFFAPEIPHVDCDDHAMMWYLWSLKNVDESWLIVMMDGLNIRSAHYFTVVRIGVNHYLCNYDWDSVPRLSLDGCIAQFQKHILTRWGQYKEPVLLIDKHFVTEE
jgi:hypothetical protein